PVARLPAPARPLRPAELDPIGAESAAGLGGAAGGAVTAFRRQLLRHGPIGSEGVGVQLRGGRVESPELTAPQKGQPFVVIPRLIFPAEECRKGGKDQGLGLAAKHVPEPLVVAANAGHAPVNRTDRRRDRRARFALVTETILAHGHHETRARSQNLTRFTT